MPRTKGWTPQPGSELWKIRENALRVARARMDHVIRRHNGNVSAAARELGLARSTLACRLKALGYYDKPKEA